MAAGLTAFYSDDPSSLVTVNYGKDKLDKSISVMKPNSAKVEGLRIC